MASLCRQLARTHAKIRSNNNHLLVFENATVLVERIQVGYLLSLVLSPVVTDGREYTTYGGKRDNDLVKGEPLWCVV